METIDSMKEFVGNYPQKINGNLQYVFAGGSSIRLHQEKYSNKMDRKIGDFDLVVFGSEKYPVQTFDSRFKLVEGGIDPTEYVDFVNLDGQDYYFTNSNFTAVSKTCSINIPCEKGYFDVKKLNEMGVLNFDDLGELYGLVDKLKCSGELASNELEKILGEDNLELGSKMFVSFPHYANLLSHFENFSQVKDIFKNYLFDNSEKEGYSISVVVGKSEEVLNEFRDFSDSEKSEIFQSLLNFSKDKTHIEFDQKISRGFLFSLREHFGKEKLNDLNLLETGVLNG